MFLILYLDGRLSVRSSESEEFTAIAPLTLLRFSFRLKAKSVIDLWTKLSKNTKNTKKRGKKKKTKQKSKNKIKYNLASQSVASKI